MREALDSLQKDDGFLLADEDLTAEMIQQWIEIKLETENFEGCDRFDPDKIRIYFDVLSGSFNERYNPRSSIS
jgi:hypothetical protein